MRIAYLLTWSGGRDTGVFKKVVAQVEQWRQLGVEVGIFVATAEGSATDWLSSPSIARVCTYASSAQSVAVQTQLATDLIDWSPDLTYVRTSPRHIAAMHALLFMPRVLEIQSDDVAEARQGGLLRWTLALSTRRVLQARVKGFAFVTHELRNSKRFPTRHCQSIVIGNGIDLSSIPHLGIPESSSPRPRFLFLGHENTSWHGVDEILGFAARRPDLSFELVGPQPYSIGHVTSNVNVHGRLAHEEYVEIAAACDVAIGTLALYRNGMNEASPLKTREYLALGLPVVAGYMDTDLNSSDNFYLRIPNSPGSTMVAEAAINRFIDHWRGKRVERHEIARLDWSIKEQSRIRFLESIVG